MNRWILPILGASALHCAMFTMDWGFANRPVLMIPESKAVAISLVELAPPAPVTAQKPLAPAAPPKRKAVKRLFSNPIADPARLPQAPPPSEPALEKPSSPDPVAQEDNTPSAPQAALGSAPTVESSDPVQIKASVPLYHLNPPPSYPAVARRRNYQGTTLLDVLVDRKGTAAQVKVHQSSGFPMLDRSALDAVRQWRFEPARRMGQAVQMWVQVPVRFELK